MFDMLVWVIPPCMTGHLPAELALLFAITCSCCVGYGLLRGVPANR
jgi:hypothetical protein